MRCCWQIGWNFYAFCTVISRWVSVPHLQQRYPTVRINGVGKIEGACGFYLQRGGIDSQGKNPDMSMMRR